MPRLRALVVRLLVLLLGTQQASAPALASVADGTLALRAGPASPYAHLEDGRQASCRVTHADECVLCASLLVLAAPSRAELHERDAACDAAAPRTRDEPGEAPRPVGARPRAPPTV